LVWTGETPLEVEKMEALPDGFRFTFTLPLDSASFHGLTGFKGSSYTYLYHATYGSPEVETQELNFAGADLAADHRSITLKCSNLRAGFVHEIELPELASEHHLPLWHRMAYYTLNRIPATP
jgi:hypothetical protein